MKKARDDKRIQTIPKGVYEGGEINSNLRKNKNNTFKDKASDSQGNAYIPPDSNTK